MRNVVTTRDKLRSAFARLRRAGYAARMNFSCCGSCGSYELSELVGERRLKGYVFWNRQSNDAFDSRDGLRRSLWLGWNGDPAIIVAALREAGLEARHDGSESRCVEVLSDAEALEAVAAREAVSR